MRPLSHKMAGAARALARGLSVTAAAREAGVSRERLSRAIHEQGERGDFLRSEVARLQGQDPGGDPLARHREKAAQVLADALDNAPPATRARLSLDLLRSTPAPATSTAAPSTAAPPGPRDPVTTDAAFRVVAQAVGVLTGSVARGRQPSPAILDRFRQACRAAAEVQPGTGQVDHGAPVPPRLPPEPVVPPAPSPPRLLPVH